MKNLLFINLKILNLSKNVTVIQEHEIREFHIIENSPIYGSENRKVLVKDIIHVIVTEG